MYKDKLDNLLERGVLSRDEYDKFFESMYEDNNGQMLGAVSYTHLTLPTMATV